MPLTSKGKEILQNMEKQYGSKEKAEQVLYASKNAGKISGIDRAAVDRIMDARRQRLADGPFKKLENKVANENGVHDPAAVAAAAGRTKLGQQEMTRRSVAGRK